MEENTADTDSFIKGLPRDTNLFFTDNKLSILPHVYLRNNVFITNQPIIFVHTSKTGGTNIDYLVNALAKTENFKVSGAHLKCEGTKSVSIVTEGCIGGIKHIQNNMGDYDLSKKQEIKFVFGHMPLPMNDYFHVKVSYISIVRDPVDRAISLGNYLYQRNFIEQDEIENLLLTQEVDNLQTRAIAGENYMQGLCTEETYLQAIKNIKETFAVVAPIDEIDVLMSLVAGHFNVQNVAYSKAQITGAKIVSKENTELCVKLLDRNIYDRKLYDFVKDYWKSWKATNIESISENISNDNYMLLSESFYRGDKIEYLTYQQITEVGIAQTAELIGFTQHYWNQ